MARERIVAISGELVDQLAEREPALASGRNQFLARYMKRELDEAVGGYEVYPYTDLRIPSKEAEYLVEFERVLEKRTKEKGCYM